MTAASCHWLRACFVRDFFTNRFNVIVMMVASMAGSILPRLKRPLNMPQSTIEWAYIGQLYI